MRSRDGSVKPIAGRPGVWRVSVSRGYGPDGERLRRTRIVRGTEKQAYEAKRMLAAELDTWTASSDMTVREFLEDVWLKSVAEDPEVRRLTRIGYAGIVKRHIVPSLGTVKLSALSPYHADRLLAKLAKTPTANQPKDGVRYLSARSRLHVYRVLHTALAEAVRWRMLVVNPMDAVSPPQVPKSRPRALSVPDALGYVTAFEGSPIESIVLVCLGAGLRRSEACGLSWADFDFDAQTVTISRGLHQDGRDVWFEAPKTVESAGTVPMAAYFSERLKALRGIGPICPDAGKPMAPAKVSRIYKKTATDAGLTVMPLKNLRHTFGTIAIAAGTDIRTVQKWMRHSTVTTTETFYLAPDDSAQVSAAERVDAVWKAGANACQVPTRAKKMAQSE